MKILVVGGGSGGHIMPAVATVKEILEIEPKAEVEFWTDRKNYKMVVELFETVELLTSLKESTVRREHEERVGRKKVKVVKRSRRREIVEGKQVRVEWVFSGKFRRYVGWKKEDYVKHFDIIIRDVVLKNFGNLFLFGFGVVQSLIRLVPKEGRPDVVFLKGGFVGLPVGLVAGWLKIPYLVHESDATPGLANRLLKKRAKLFLLGMEKAELTENERFVGVPISDEFKKVSEVGQKRLKRELGFLVEESADKESEAVFDKASGEVSSKVSGTESGRVGAKPVLIVVGGSQGSEHINSAVIRVLPELMKEVQVGIVTGKGKLNEVQARAREALGLEPKAELPEGFMAWDYSSEVEKLFGAADLVVSRAGATTLAELGVMEKAVILIPFETLPGGHQAKNARELEAKGAARVLLDEEMVDQPVKLLREVRELAGNEEMRRRLGKEIGKTGKNRVARTIAEAVVQVGRGKDWR